MNPGTVTFPNSHAEISLFQKGDYFYSEGLFAGLSDKRVKWTVTLRTNTKKGQGVVVRATYFGVHLGDYEITASKGKVKINELKD